LKKENLIAYDFVIFFDLETRGMSHIGRLIFVLLKGNTNFPNSSPLNKLFYLSLLTNRQNLAKKRDFPQRSLLDAKRIGQNHVTLFIFLEQAM